MAEQELRRQERPGQFERRPEPETVDESAPDPADGLSTAEVLRRLLNRNGGLRRVLETLGAVCDERAADLDAGGETGAARLLRQDALYLAWQARHSNN